MMVSERSDHKDVKSENFFETCLSTQKVLKVDFSTILLLKIFKFQNDISLEWIGIFQKFFPF